MAEEIDDTGFYREDFSTESEWEVFNAQISEIFQLWELSNNDWGRCFHKNEVFHCDWLIKSEQLKLLEKDFALYYYAAKLPSTTTTTLTNDIPMHQDLTSVHNTFDPVLNRPPKDNQLHILARLYGLRRFVVMRPLNQQLSNPSEFCYIVSAAAVVAAEINSTVPIFVQLFDARGHFYEGVGFAPNLRTDFNMLALERPPADTLYLSGLISMFKEKHPATYIRPITISVRNTYSLDAINVRIPMNVPFMKNSALEQQPEEEEQQLSAVHFIALPSGYFPDSSTEVLVTYTWPEIAENIAIDSPLRSDFVPSKAPLRSLHQEVYAVSYLSTCVRDFCKLQGSEKLVESYVGKNYSSNVGDAENPLEQLTKPRISKLGMTREKQVQMGVKQLKKIPGPMTESELEQMLIYLFPHLQPDLALFPYADKLSDIEFDPHRIKSAYPDSLVARLSCLLATCHAHFGGKSGMAQLWAAFVRELYILWDCCMLVPGVSAGYPDTRTCLLHQKLQMLNICMERRNQREASVGGKATTPAAALIESMSSDEEDQFFDCAEDVPTTSDNNTRPEGRQKQLSNKLILNSDEPLYVPMLQEPVPKTEDQLQIDADMLLKMGPGSELSTEMMSTSLLSDMEAFKAANPKSQMADFIRWYSPNDWLEETTTADGRLSLRMQVEGNVWQKIWQEAKPVPAWRQKRLFDDTNEALKVLQYLESRTIGQIYELTIVPILHAAVLKFKDIMTSAQVLDLFETKIDAVLADICRMSRDVEIIAVTENEFYLQSSSVEHIMEQLEILETQFYQLKCLERMIGYPQLVDLSKLKRQFRQILSHEEMLMLVKNKIEEEAEREAECKDEDIIHKLLSSDIIKNELREKLISKDYVLRIDGDNTSHSKDQTGPQFLRAIVTGTKLRLCGAFTDNTAFI